jgi:hypothetical protein
VELWRDDVIARVAEGSIVWEDGSAPELGEMGGTTPPSSVWLGEGL